MAEEKQILSKDRSQTIFYKTISGKNVNANEDSRTITGYAAVWGNVDDDCDILVKGCCAKSLQERGPDAATNRKILFLWQHEVDEPLGKPVVLKEDDIGLYFEVPIDKIPLGDRALEQIKSGTLNQFSIGFMYVWDKCEVDDNLGAFVVKEINLFEFSVVSFGCNELTSFQGMKSEQLESEQNKLLRDTEKILKTLPDASQLQIRQLIAKHIALAKAEPLEALKAKHKPQKPAQSVDWKQLTQAFN